VLSTPAPAAACAQATDPWPARLAFHLLHRHGPRWITLWLVLILGALVLLGAVAGPWVPGGITAVGALSAAGTAVAKRLGGRMPEAASDPALDPPPA
jgi:hypothetical protein